jgi:hypothetical protein
MTEHDDDILIALSAAERMAERTGMPFAVMPDLSVVAVTPYSAMRALEIIKPIGGSNED